MLLGDPPRTQFDLNFSMLGIPVRVHPLFWLVVLVLGYTAGDAISLLLWVVAVFVAILIHEMGHALTMRAYGFYPWITLYGFGGLTSYDYRYASRQSGSDTLPQILITLAGPGAGFLLAGLILLGMYAAGHGNDVVFPDSAVPIPWVRLPNRIAEELLSQLLFISIAWGIINLMPIYPLDGGQVAREVLQRLNPREGIRRSLQLSVVAAVAVAMFWLFQWGGLFVPLLFGYLAYSSIVTLRAYQGRGPW